MMRQGKLLAMKMRTVVEMFLIQSTIDFLGYFFFKNIFNTFLECLFILLSFGMFFSYLKLKLRLILPINKSSA